MLQAGSLDASGEWVEAHSLALAIEAEMVVDALVDLEEETEEAMLQRRRTLIAMARGIVGYLKEQMELHLEPGDLRDTGEADARLPRADATLAAGTRIAAGEVRAAADTGVRVPLAAKALAGKVR